MNYEIVLNLKEAGFPLKEHPYPHRKNEHLEYGLLAFPFGDKIYLFPTLSELIEACGSEFDHLKRVYGDWKWEAYYNGEEVRVDNHYFFGKGQSPEEAVANLWLELNRNGNKTN